MRKYKIILVENDEDEQLFMREGFDASNLFDLQAILDDGAALFEWLANNPLLPDVILSDLNMPGQNGYDILKDIKKDSAYSNIPVVITSTSSAPMIIDKCLGLGAADYLIKPETFIEYTHFAQRFHAWLTEKGL